MYHAVLVMYLVGVVTLTQFTNSVVTNAMGIEYRKKVNFTFDNAQFSEDQATITIT